MQDACQVTQSGAYRPFAGLYGKGADRSSCILAAPTRFGGKRKPEFFIALRMNSCFFNPRMRSASPADTALVTTEELTAGDVREIILRSEFPPVGHVQIQGDHEHRLTIASLLSRNLIP